MVVVGDYNNNNAHQYHHDIVMQWIRGRTIVFIVWTEGDLQIKRSSGNLDKKPEKNTRVLYFERFFTQNKITILC